MLNIVKVYSKLYHRPALCSGIGCIVMALEQVRLRQIGIVRSDIKAREDMPLQGVDATVEVFPEYEVALEGPDKHTHVLILCWLHRA